MVNVEGTSTDTSPVTHVALVEINNASIHDMPLYVALGSIRSPAPTIIIIKKLDARISEGFVFRPKSRTKKPDSNVKDISRRTAPL